LPRRACDTRTGQGGLIDDPVEIGWLDAGHGGRHPQRHPGDPEAAVAVAVELAGGVDADVARLVAGRREGGSDRHRHA